MQLLPALDQYFIDGDGLPIAGGKLHSYAAGTSDELATYADASGTPNTNPVILDSNGRATIWIDPAFAYKFVLTDADDNVLRTRDGVRWIPNGSVGTAALAAGAVTNEKLGANSVSEGKLQDGSVTANKLGAGAVGSGKIAAGAVTNDKTDNYGLVPPGVTAPYFGAAAPDGWLLCNGAAVSRTTYAALFAAIGEACGEGDGSTTFNLPDLRGRFLRGVDGGASVDPDAAGRTAMATGGNTGDAVGSVQDDQIKSHIHPITQFVISALNGAYFMSGNDATPQGGTQNSVAAGGSETRPKNAGVNFIIKT